MKMRNKGKVHPFTSSSSSSSSSSSEFFSVLKLLPAAILTLVSFLSLEEREVLAYMITRSLKSTNPSIFPATEDKKRTSKKQQCGGHNSPALFDCDCFHCYTSFWFRWDSSPNRELIHQAIEAFEDHLSTGEHHNNGKAKRRDKLGRRRTEKVASSVTVAVAVDAPVSQERAFPPTVAEVEPPVLNTDEVGLGSAEKVDSAAPAVVVRTHKGLARKVLPDVMGIFTSRLWSLWSPNV